tara:strand:+ start:285 stop:482 length:198 start_codon:yes stop_codon:yes gene_type:complete
MSKDRNITEGPKKHKDLIIDRVKRIFSKGPTHKGEDKAVYDTKESGTNSYHANNLKMIKDLKRDA